MSRAESFFAGCGRLLLRVDIHARILLLMNNAITLRLANKTLTIRFGNFAVVTSEKIRQLMSNEAARVLALELAQCGWESV